MRNQRLHQLRLVSTVPVALVCLCAAPTAGQSAAEVQVGVVGGYAFQDTYNTALGASGGLLLARILYAGGRFVRYFGSSSQMTQGTVTTDVDISMNLLAGDLGVMIPFRKLNVLATATMGSARFLQTTKAADAGAVTETNESEREFLFAPGLGLMVNVLGLRVVGEAQYFLTKSPSFNSQIEVNSFVLQLRVLYPIDLVIYPIGL